MSPRPGSLSARLETRTTVLVVEDEADIAGFLGAYFRASGLEMVHVNPRGPEEVVDAVRSHHAECVLLDLNLVGFSGLDVLARFREDPALAAIPVVVVSAHTAATNQCHDLGARAFVAKPFNVSDLYDQVAAMVGGETPPAPTGAPAPTPAPSGPSLTSDELEEKIGRALLRAHRDGTPLSLVLVRAVAHAEERLRAGLPNDALVGCTGPDEFAVLLPGTAAPEASSTVGAVLESLDARAGVASAPEHASTIDELYMAADAALADACDSGRAVATAR